MAVTWLPVESTGVKKEEGGKRKSNNTQVPKEQGPLEENKWELRRTGYVQRGDSPSSRFQKCHLGNDKAQESWHELEVKFPRKDQVKGQWSLETGRANNLERMLNDTVEGKVVSQEPTFSRNIQNGQEVGRWWQKHNKKKVVTQMGTDFKTDRHGWIKTGEHSLLLSLRGMLQYLENSYSYFRSLFKLSIPQQAYPDPSKSKSNCSPPFTVPSKATTRIHMKYPSLFKLMLFLSLYMCSIGLWGVHIFLNLFGA